jgi:hypothetical protein
VKAERRKEEDEGDEGEEKEKMTMRSCERKWKKK